MSDYRNWCDSCGEETSFGRHAVDCLFVVKQRMKDPRVFRKFLNGHHNYAMLDVTAIKEG